MTKISRLILNAFFLLIFAVNSFAYTPLSRVRNFVNDAANNVPITASYMDAELNQDITALNATMVVQATSPSSPFEGMTWYNTTLHVIEEYRNNEWIIIGALHVNSSAMANPQQGDLWYNTSTNNLESYNGASFVSSAMASSNIGIGTAQTNGNALLIDGGNVGIGTNNPGAILDIIGGARSSNGFDSPYIKFTNTQTSGTSAGDSTSGSWLTAIINTKDNDVAGIATLCTGNGAPIATCTAANQMILPAGTYNVNGSMPLYNNATGTTAQIRLYNVTGSAILVNGQTSYTGGVNTLNPSRLDGRFTLAGTTVIVLQYQVSHSTPGGQGIAASYGTEVYATLIFLKVQ